MSLNLHITRKSITWHLGQRFHFCSLASRKANWSSGFLSVAGKDCTTVSDTLGVKFRSHLVLSAREIYAIMSLIYSETSILHTTVPRRPTGDAYCRGTRWTLTLRFLTIVVDFKTNRTVPVGTVKARDSVE